MWDKTKQAYKTVGEYKTVDEIMEEVLKDEVFYQGSGGELHYQAAKFFSKQTLPLNF